MTEPIYVYIKGKGWIIQQYPVITMHCGTVVRLEPRRPGIGEVWLRSSVWVNADGSPDMDQFSWCIKEWDRSFQALSYMRKTTRADVLEHDGWRPAAWVTVVPI